MQRSICHMELRRRRDERFIHERAARLPHDESRNDIRPTIHGSLHARIEHHIHPRFAGNQIACKTQAPTWIIIPMVVFLDNRFLIIWFGQTHRTGCQVKRCFRNHRKCRVSDPLLKHERRSAK